MGFERRIFGRTDVEVQGHLQWQEKRFFGVKTCTVPVQTIDLSVEGAKILLDRKVNLPEGASVRLIFHDESSPARVRSILTREHDPSTKMARLQLEQPPPEFMRVIEHWLDACAGGRQFQESSQWLGNGLQGDIFPGGERNAS